MTSSNGPQTGVDADSVWPPTIERAVVAPDTKQQGLRRGRFALLSALTGIGLAALVIAIGSVAIGTGWVQSVPQAKGVQLTIALQAVYLIGLICEAVAVITAIRARRTRTGRWGMALALLMLVASFLWGAGLMVGVVFPNHNEWPWAGDSDYNCCHEKMGPDG